MTENISGLFKKLLLEKKEKDDLNYIKNFLETNEKIFNINDVNKDDFDLLIYLIHIKSSIEIIQFIINKCEKYSFNLNYETKKGEIPLFLTFINAIQNNSKINDSLFFNEYYMKLFDLLERNGASINYCNEKGESLLIHLYNKELLNMDIFRILYYKKINISYFLEKLYIAYSDHDHDDNNDGEDNIIFGQDRNTYKNDFENYLNVAHSYHYNEKNFIMRMLEMYKNKSEISDKQLEFLHNFYKMNSTIHIPFEYLNELIESGKITTLNYLLDTTIKIFNNKYTLTYNTYQRSKDYLKKLKSETSNYVIFYNLNDLDRCIQQHDYEEANFILDQGFNFNYDPHKCYTDINFIKACKDNNEEAIRYLVEYGANMNHTTYCCYGYDGQPLTYVMDKFRIRGDDDSLKNTVKYLINHGSRFSIHFDYNFKFIQDEVFKKYIIEHGYRPDILFRKFKKDYCKIKYLMECSNEMNEDEFYQSINDYIKDDNQELIRYFVKDKGYHHNFFLFNKPLLYYLYSNNQRDLTKHLIEKGMSVNSMTEKRKTLIYKACKLNDLDMVKYLIRKGANNYNKTINTGHFCYENAFSISCRMKNFEITKYLLENLSDIEVNFRHDFSGNTPLLTVIKHGGHDLVPCLVEYGAQINVKNKDGVTPLMMASKKGFYDVVKYLVEHEEKVSSNVNYCENSSFANASEKEYPDIVQSLANININQKDNRNNTALMMACKNGHFDIVQYLVEHGAKINTKNKFNETPLIFACLNERFDMVQYLVDHGADIHCENNYGQTPLKIALLKNNDHLTQYFIDHHSTDASYHDSDHSNNHSMNGKNFNDSIIKKDLWKRTVQSLKFPLNNEVYDLNFYQYNKLTIACIDNNIKLAQYIIETSDDSNIVNRTDQSGLTPLMIACIYNNFDIITLLVEHHADVNKKYPERDLPNYCHPFISKFNIYSETFQNYSPIHFLSYHQNLSKINYLINHGSDVTKSFSSSTEKLLSILNEPLQYEILLQLIYKGIEIEKNYDKDTILIEHCLEEENLSKIKYFIGKGIKIEPHLSKIVMLSRKKSDTELIKYLLEQDNLSLDDHWEILRYLKDTITNMEIFLGTSEMLVHYLKSNEFSILNDRISEFEKEEGKKTLTRSFLIHLSKLAIQERDIDLLRYLSSKYYINIYKMVKEEKNLLMEVYEEKQYPFLKYLLDYGLKDDHDFSFGDSKGKRRKRLLMKVCEDNNLEILQLIGYNVDMNSHNALDAPDDTPLMVACEHGYLDMVKYFVKIHCDLNKRNRNGFTALDKACMNEHTEIFIYLIESGASIERSYDQFGKSLLMLACQMGTEEMVEYLMNSRSSHKKWIQREINRVNEKNETALMYACLRGNYDIVKCLVDHQADVRIKSKYNGTALNYAVQGSNDKIVEFLLCHTTYYSIDTRGKYGETEMITACKNNHFNMVKSLVEAGAKIDEKDYQGYTGLLWACENENHEMIRFLIGKGANIHICNDYGYNALVLLCKNDKNLESIELLLENGIDLEHRTKKDGHTALTYSCHHRQYKISKYLINHGVDINCYDWKRSTPFMISLHNKDYKFSEYLLKCGANLFSFDHKNVSALSYCILSNCNELLDFIISNYLIYNKLSIYNYDELMHAIKMDNYRMIKYLLDHGVNINYKSEEVREARSKLLKEILSEKEDLTMFNYLLRQGLKLTGEDHVIFSESIFGNHYDENYEEFMGRSKYLIEHDITFFIKNDDYRNHILLYAFNYNLYDVVKQLIDYGMDIKKELEGGRSIIQVLSSQDGGLSRNSRNEKFVETMKYIFSYNKSTFSKEDYIDLIERFTQIGEVELVKFLCGKIENLNKVINDIFLLHTACKVNSYELVQWLIENGADINLKSKSESRYPYQSPLEIACHHNNTDIITLLITSHANLHEPFTKGSSILEVAFQNKNLEVIQCLVEYGGEDGEDSEDSGVGLDAMITSSSSRCQLYLKKRETATIEWLDFKTMDYLLHHGMSIDQRNSEGYTALMIASIHNQLDVVNYLMAHGANAYLMDNRGMNSVALACENNNFEIVKYFMNHEEKKKSQEGTNASASKEERKVSKTSGDDDNEQEGITKIKNRSSDIQTMNKIKPYSALQVAFDHHYYGIAEYLIEHGGDLKEELDPSKIYSIDNLKGEKVSSTIIDFLKKKNEFTALKKNISNKNNNKNNLNEVLLEACLKENMDMIRTFLHQQLLKNSQDFNINSRDKYGRTALSIAVGKRNLEMVKLLVENGADVNIFNRNKYTPLMTSCRNGSLSIVKYLIAHGSDYRIVNQFGESAAHIAYHYENFEIVQYLIDHGFDINSPGKYGTSLLMMACEKGHLINLHYFLSKGADVNHQNDLWDTPLIYASEQGYLGIVKALIQQGATTSINYTNKLGDTALRIAFTNKFIGLVTYLKSQGAQ